MSPANKNDNEARERAREALSGGRAPRHRESHQIGAEVTPPLNLPPAEMVKRRESARASMEGYEWRERHKALEQRRIDELALQKKLTADLAAKRQIAEETMRAKERAEAEAVATAAIAKKRRLEQVTRSEQMIEKIKHDPTITIKGVRTFKEDLAESLRHGGNIAEITQGETIDQYGKSRLGSPLKRQKMTVSLGIIGLILAGGGIVVGTWYIVNRAPTIPAEIKIQVNSLIPAESNQELFLTGQLSLHLRQEIYQKRFKAATDFAVARAGGGPILNLYPTEALSIDKKTNKPTNKIQVDLTRFLAALDLALPIDFRVALGDQFMVGIYQSPTPAIFYLFKVLSYERAGSSLAKSDSTLADTLFSPLLNDLDFSRSLRDNGFKNEVINNTEVKVARNTEGEVIMLYAFLDQQTLLLTEKVEAFEKILGLYQTPLPVSR